MLKLLAYRKTAGESSLETKLFLGDRSIDAALTDLHGDPSHPGTAVARLRLGSKPGPGKYTGSLLMSSLVPGAPGLPVEVRSRAWVVWAILTILAGVLSAAALYQFLGLRRRKQLLSGALEQVVDNDYGENRDLNFVGGTAGRRQLIWNLSIEYPLRVNNGWNYWDDLDSAENIYTAIHWARNDADLDEAQAAALKLIHDVKSWMLALTEVRGLWELFTVSHDPAPVWETTKVHRDTALLLLRARRTPGDALLSSQLMALVGRQTAWHRVFAQAWDLKQELLRAGGSAAQRAAQVNIEAVDAGAVPVAERTDAQQDELDLSLSELYEQLLEIRQEAAPTVPVVVVSADREQQSAARRSELQSLASSLRPEVALANFRASGVSALVPATAVPEGPIAAPGAPAAAPALAPAQAPPQPTPEGHSGRPSASATQGRLLHGLRRLDLLLSFATLLVTSILYVGTIYTDTWGTLGDFATAFGAGFAGLVTVKWALLPIFRSVRLGPAAASGTTPSKATAPAS